MIHSKPTQHLWKHKDFRKSTYSNGGAAGNCAAIAYHDGSYAIADTKLLAGDSYVLINLKHGDVVALLGHLKR